MTYDRQKLKDAWPKDALTPYHQVTHLNGIPWDQASIPGPFHRHWAQTSEWRGFDQWVTCACGATQSTFDRTWSARTRSFWRRK